MSRTFRRNKYRVSAPEERTWCGKTYASRAECERAKQLWFELAQGTLRVVIEQPLVHLGVRENKYRPDFFVIRRDGDHWFEDVKGMETAEFKRNKRLWATYGPAPLHVVTRKANAFVVSETIPAGDKPCLPLT